MLECGTSPSPETVAAPEMLVGKKWTVDNSNWEAALLALADGQPNNLRLVARDDAREALPVAAVAKAAKGCAIGARFIDTFYSADKSATDSARLEHLTANQSLRLTMFFGHLDFYDIAQLPHTITSLGLAIGNATDAEAVCSLRPWQGLLDYSVSVSSRVAAKDLKPLPSVRYYHIYFPFLSDAGVDSVRPAIEALAPDLRITSLRLPKSQLTADGARHLATQLRGVTVTDGVTIEVNGTWRPEDEEKESVASEFRNATDCLTLELDMDWLYKHRTLP